MPAKKQITKKLNTALKLLKEQGYGAVNTEQPPKKWAVSRSLSICFFRGWRNCNRN